MGEPSEFQSNRVNGVWPSYNPLLPASDPDFTGPVPLAVTKSTVTVRRLDCSAPAGSPKTAQYTGFWPGFGRRVRGRRRSDYNLFTCWPGSIT